MHITTRILRRSRLLAVTAAFAVAATGCGSDETAQEATTSVEAVTPVAVASPEPEDPTPVEASPVPAAAAEPAVEPTTEPTAEGAPAVASTFTAEVWADNWFAFYANGVLVGEDSVPITTERSFNAETFTFEATYPLTIAIEAKDFKETDSGLEYIGERNQQMGDGGIIAQVTDVATGEVVAVTNGDWQALVVHRAPLNPECESSADPDAECVSEIIAAPAGWAEPSFDAAGWNMATVWSEAAVSPKDGYDRIDWSSTAALVWGADLEVDNTVLLRTTVS